MNIIDAVSICILVLFVLFGIYKGFISTLLNIGAYFVSVVLGFLLKPLGASAIKHSDRIFNMKDPKMPRLFKDTNSPSSSRQVMSTFWLKDVAYCRLKNLQIGYTLPKQIVNTIGLNKVRVYYSCENLFTIDNLDLNMDPEATSQRLSSYPLLRTHSFGLSVTF